MISRIQDIDTFGQDFEPGEVYIPSRSLVQQNEDVLNRVVQAQQSPTVTTPTGKVVSGGVPLNVFGVTATESPSKQQDRTFSQVSVSFNRYGDTSFAGVRIWFTGYKANTNPVLMTDGQDSPISFLCETTGESVVVTVQSVGVDGTPADFGSAPTAVVALDGVISAPPAPSIAQFLTSVPLGFQFAFNQISLGATQDVIDSYRVYRFTSNTPGSAGLRFTFKHDPTSSGSIVVQDNVGGGQTFYYWVTAVNTRGLESAKTQAQSSAHVSGGVDPSGPDVGAKGSIPPSAATAFTFTTTTTSITWSWTGLTIFRVDGTTLAVTDGTRATTGLTSGTTYYFYPYWDEINLVVGWVNGSGNGSTGEAFLAAQRTNTVAQSQNLQSRVPLSTGPMPAATPASGTGGGGGGGSGTCVRSHMLVEERTKGIIPASLVRPGDQLRTPESDGWTDVIVAREQAHDTFVRIGVAGHYLEVTPTHPLMARDEFFMPLDVFAGKVTLLHQLDTRQGYRFIESIQLVKDPQGKKVYLSLSQKSHLFYAGETSPDVVAHNVSFPC